MNPDLTESKTHLLTQKEQQAAEAFLERLNRRFPEQILQAILFGSKARGDSRADSDIDILLIVDTDDWRFSHQISAIAADVSLEYNVLLGPRVIGRAHWERMERERFSLYQNVAVDGIPLLRKQGPRSLGPGGL